jgi:cytochrome b561
MSARVDYSGSMSTSSWDPLAKLFHWGMAALIGYQLWLGWRAEDLPFSPKKLDLFVTHKSIGLTLLLLVFLRLAWRGIRARPPHPPGTGVIEQRLAEWGHRLLYALMIAIPVSGWWISDTSRIPFKLFGAVRVPDLMNADKASSELAADVHEALIITLVVLLGIHVAAALRHQFILKDNSLKRMLPWA